MLRDVAAIRGAAKTVTAGQQMTLSRPKERARERALVIERFERRERSRPQMRVFEFAVMATLYAKERCNGNIDVAYQELIKALDKGG